MHSIHKFIIILAYFYLYSKINREKRFGPRCHRDLGERLLGGGLCGGHGGGPDNALPAATIPELALGERGDHCLRERARSQKIV